MRDRTSLVLELIKNPKTAATISQELAAYDWHSENIWQSSPNWMCLLF